MVGFLGVRRLVCHQGFVGLRGMVSLCRMVALHRMRGFLCQFRYVGFGGVCRFLHRHAAVCRTAGV